MVLGYIQQALASGTTTVMVRNTTLGFSNLQLNASVFKTRQHAFFSPQVCSFFGVIAYCLVFFPLVVMLIGLSVKCLAVVKASFLRFLKETRIKMHIGTRM